VQAKEQAQEQAKALSERQKAANQAPPRANQSTGSAGGEIDQAVERAPSGLGEVGGRGLAAFYVVADHEPERAAARPEDNIPEGINNNHTSNNTKY
jgi:hypothetical protein